ncbi:MAG: hypothetical protein WD529_04935 [Balneolaceae bacterium]
MKPTLFSTTLITLVLLLLSGTTTLAQEADSEEFNPPFNGTIFINPDIITPDDPSSFVDLTYKGQELRRMYDRRENSRVEYNAFLFEATFDDGLTIEMQVNPEFETAEEAERQARFFAHPIGQLPTALRADVETSWIHKGNNPFGGGSNNLLIHTGMADRYIEQGILEETLVHEAAHTSIDGYHARSEDWVAAQVADNNYISTYGRDHRYREDIAESILPWLAIRHFPDRIPDELRQTIEETIPNRIDYFDAQDFDLYPLVE